MTQLHTIKKSGLQWKTYRNADHIVDRFSASDWLKIFPMYPTEQEFREYTKRSRWTMKTLILTKINTGETLGFVALIFHSPRTVAIHGGAWATSLADRMTIYRGMFILFRYLFAKGLKIISFSADNHRAVRFMKSFGFRIFSYRYSLTHYHLTKDRMMNSPFYKRFG